MRLIHGDCLKEMPKLAEENIKVDMILTDLPYGTTACKWDNIIPFTEMWECINQVSNENTPVLLFGSEPFSSNLRMSNIKNYKYDIIWHKNTSGDFALANKRIMKYHEIISVFYKKQPTYNPQFQEYYESTKKRYKDGESVNRSKQLHNSTNKIQNGLSLNGSPIDYKRGKYPESVQYFQSVHNMHRLHPTQKPVPLLEYLIKTYTNKGDTVLDFTMGSGSTGVACQNLNRDFIGIELDKEYYDITVERVNNMQSRLI